VTTDLDHLLACIHPARTLEQVECRASEAINTFPMPSGRVGEWDEFRYLLIRFLRHLDTHLLSLRKPCPAGPDFEWGRCAQVLMQAYGPEGEKAAFEMARTGNEGGLYGVLKEVARRMAESYAVNETTARVGRYWNGLSADEQLAVGDDYLRRYGHLLPSELTEGSAARLRANLPRVLREHPALVRRMAQIGRT